MIHFHENRWKNITHTQNSLPWYSPFNSKHVKLNYILGHGEHYKKAASWLLRQDQWEKAGENYHVPWRSVRGTVSEGVGQGVGGHAECLHGESYLLVIKSYLLVINMNQDKEL